MNLVGEIVLLIVAILFFYQSLRMLYNDVLPIRDRTHRSKVEKNIQLVSALIGLFLWFLAGVIAFVVSISGFTNHFLLGIQ